MPAFICNTCGTQFAPTAEQPKECPICLDERQFVPPTGQTWTTLDALNRRHSNQFKQHEPGVLGIGSVPPFAINQRALLLRTSAGNILWDCITVLDAATVDIVRALGGIAGIAISHPHYYASMVEWAHTFNAPIHLHAADKQWVMYPDASIKFWDGETKSLADGVTLIRCGGHFAGGTVLHSTAAGGGKGALMSGDIVMVIPDRKYVSFMRSYPNIVPMSAAAVERIGASLAPYTFEVIYGAFFDRTVMQGGNAAVERSVKRYAAAVRGDGSAELQ